MGILDGKVIITTGAAGAIGSSRPSTGLPPTEPKWWRSTSMAKP